MPDDENENKNVTMTISMPADLRRRIEEAAEAERRSVSNLIRIMLEDKLSEVAR
jgi:predicted transcriptional regulator